MTEIPVLGDKQVYTFYRMELGSVGLIIGGKFRVYGTKETIILGQNHVLKTLHPDGTPVLKIIEICNSKIQSISDESYIPDLSSPPIPIFIIPEGYISKFG